MSPSADTPARYSGPGFQDQVERSLFRQAPVGEAGLGEDVGEPGRAGLAPERRARLRGELRKRLDVGDAPFRLSARAWCVVGRVP